MDRPVLDLTWDYPTWGPQDEPDADQVLAEINGRDADGKPLSRLHPAQVRRLHILRLLDLLRGAGRRGESGGPPQARPASRTGWPPEWGWAWPANRRVLYNRASADRDGKPWSERKALVWWDEEKGKWTGHDIPDFIADRAASYRPPDDAVGVDAISGIDPFIMQADGKAWLFTPAGLVDGPMPAHYEPQESPLPNLFYGQQHNPVRQIISHPDNRYQPSGREPGSDVFPYVTTTYRLTEHHTAGGMSRFLPYLSELQPAFFCEVSPELAAERGLEHMGWATIISARNAIEARVMVTRRMKPLRAGGREIQQVGLPWHWGLNGLTTGDSANELSHLSLDPNVHIQEVKALAVDIQPGRRPRGPGSAIWSGSTSGEPASPMRRGLRRD